MQAVATIAITQTKNREPMESLNRCRTAARRPTRVHAIFVPVSR